MSGRTAFYEQKHPKIGIRPVVDGRRNISFQATCSQSMKLAQLAKKLYEENLRYPDGSPVVCVVHDTCIDGAAESARCSRSFREQNVGLTLSVAPCWCFVTEVMHLEPGQPQAIWGLNGTERPGAVYLSAMLAAHNQLGMPAFQIYGRDVQEKNDDTIPPDVEEKLLRFAVAGLAVAELRGRSYLGIGTVSMGIAGAMGHESFFLRYLGMLTEHADMCEIDRRIRKGIYDQQEYERAIEWVKQNCPEGRDWNPPQLTLLRERKDEVWEQNVKMALIIRDMMEGNPRLAEMGYGEEAKGHNALAAGFQGQRNWTDYLPNGDFPEAILNSSFDWNGIRRPYVVATENDSLNGAAMLLMHLVTGCAQGFADMRTYWSPEAVEKLTGYRLQGEAAGGFLHLINSGSAALDACGRQERDGAPAMKPHWEITEDEARACLNATTWGAADQEMFAGGGFSSTFLTRGGMPMTMARISVVEGLGPVMQLAEGYSAELPQPVFDAINERTNPTWPSTFFVPRLTGEAAFSDVYEVMAAWGANHGAFCGGHIGDRLITLCSMLRIPVTMHNVEEKRVFRPSAWKLFSARCADLADLEACRSYGPLY